MTEGIFFVVMRSAWKFFRYAAGQERSNHSLPFEGDAGRSDVAAN
jgi:hypothetical protein